CKNANVRFVAGVEEFAFAAWCDGENLTFVAGCDIQSPVRSKSEIPDVFCFRLEENGFFASCRDFVDFTVGRSRDVKCALRIEGNCFGRKISRLKNCGRFAIRIEANYFCWGTASSVRCAL